MENKFSIIARNSDDAELRLPPDVFFKNVHSRFSPHRRHHHHHHHLPFSFMDDLDEITQRLANLRLPKHMRKPHRPTNFERLKEPVRYGSTNRADYRVGEIFAELTTGSFRGETKPAHEVKFFKPAQAPVESYVEARAGALIRQQNRLVQNRVLQVKPNGLSNTKKFGLGGGFGRESGGTGVFHPRIVDTNNRNGTVFDSKKKQSLRNRQISFKEIEVSSGKMNSKKRVNVVGEQQNEDCYYHLPPEMFA